MLAVFFFIALVYVISSGCIAGGTDRIVGTWEWSDGKGYVERYTFNEDHSFQAKRLDRNFQEHG